MTARAAAALLREQLRSADVGDPAFEARLLLQAAFGQETGARMFVCDEALTSSQQQTLFGVLQRRLAGEPLQYLCGAWGFLDSSFAVGEGVLIPRPETEELVLLALERMTTMAAPTVFDLCAGTGCIGLSVKKRRADAEVVLFELSDTAMRYCEENRASLGMAQTVRLVRCDVLQGFESLRELPEPDVLLSNPPYIPSGELSALQREVQREPSLALDGGADGLTFYRCLAERWLPRVRPGGLVGVECGDDQARTVAAMFERRGFVCEICKDFNDIERFVIARRGKEREEFA